MLLHILKLKSTNCTVLILLLSCINWARSFNSVPLSTCRLNSRYGRSAAVLLATSTDSLLSTQENAMISLFERVRPSVVYVSTFLQAFNPLLMNVMEVPSQTGSGRIRSKITLLLYDSHHLLSLFYWNTTAAQLFTTTFNAIL